MTVNTNASEGGFGYAPDTEHDEDIDTLVLADGDLFELPGVQGRLERIEFPNGMYLHRAELNVREDSCFNVKNSLPPGWIAGSINVMGNLRVDCPDGASHPLTPDQGMVMRIDPLGTRYFLPAGQKIRHVGVACVLGSLRDRFGETLPKVFDPFLSKRDDVVLIKPLALTNRMRSIVSSMFSSDVTGAGRMLKLEGLSTLFLAEMIESYTARSEFDTSDGGIELSALDQAIFDELTSLIKTTPGGPLGLSQLAVKFEMPESRVNSLLKSQTGKTCAEYVRSERMAIARDLLTTGDLSIKEIAAHVGFSHVSNFSRSYRDWYGESPASALLRK